jgi:hypothetical protein
MHSLTLIVPGSFVQNSTGRSSLRPASLLIQVALALFAISPTVQAVDPPPDGGYPNFNTAEGEAALFSLSTGSNNTAIGALALELNTIGTDNTATGFDALRSNTTGNDNTATGVEALFSNTTGSFNTASGLNALASNSTGTANTANGSFALIENTIGNNNTASGDGALFNNTSGDDNTATGVDALLSNTTGANNTASGTSALQSNTTGYYNVGSGVSALFYNVVGHDNTGEGFQALLNAKGSNNIGIGSNAGANLSNGSNNIDIGNVGVAGDAAKIRIGKQGTQTATYIAGIYGKTVASGTRVGVMIDSTGKLGTVVSSARFKEAIKPMDKASEAILALKPVTFRYKEELDPDGMPQFGLIAEEVEKVNPDLVVRDEDGKVNTVRYEAVNAMLLNEFLKEHRKVEELRAIVAKQDATNAQQQKQIEALTVGLQRVTAQLESGKPAPRIALND